MRTAFPLSSHPALLLLLPGIVLTVLFGLSQGVREDTSGYWVGAISSATSFTVFACTFAALGGALSANRLRRGQIMQLAPARSALQIAWTSLWPSIALGVVLQTIGVLIASSGSWGAPGRFPFEILLAWSVMILFHAYLGYALGLALPTFLGIPAAVLISYVWLGFTWSVSFTPLRYLSGLALAGCCAVYAELPWEAPATVILFSAVGMVALAFFLRSAGTRAVRITRFAVGIAAIALVTPASLWLARDLGPYPSPPRSDRDLVCSTEQGTEVCLYPEQLWNPVTPNVTGVIAHALGELEDQGIRVPTRVTGALLDDSDGSVSLVYRRDFVAATAVNSLMTSVTPQRQEGDICPRDDVDPTPALLVSDVAVSAMYVMATQDEESLETRDPEAAASAETLLQMDKADRAEWINDALRALDDCSLPLPEAPVPAQL